MKGVVFSEFIDMVEAGYSLELADEIIEESDLPSGGAYTAVGTYDHGEMLALIAKLSEKTGTPVAELVEGFGRYLFGRFFALYPSFFEGVDGAFGFLSRIEDYVHSEVQKLYNDVELPTFKTHQPNPNELVMVYQSRRPFADLALGLIKGCIDHYQESIEIQQEDLSSNDRTHVRFQLKRL
jgi:hypothetical protein